MKETGAVPGRGRRRLRWVAAGLALALLAALVVAVSFRDVAALAILRSVAHGFGYDVAAANLNVNLSEADLRNVRVRNAAGEPVLEARRIDVAYSLRDLLPGGKRLYGLRAVDVEGPHVTVIHHPDGTYNITIPAAPARPAPVNPPPLDVRLRVSDGSLDLIDRFASAPRVRTARLSGVHAEGVVSPAAGSYYHAAAQFDDGSGRYPIRGNARFDDPRGFELQHWTVAELPVAVLANFALSTRALLVEGGELRNIDIKLGALAAPGGGMQSHLGISADLVGGRVASPALAKPIRDAHGSLVVDDDSATVRSLDAAINGIPLHVSGALYHFAAPQIAFALTARGDLDRVRGLTKDSARLPLAGPVALQALAEGPASNPLVVTRIGAPRVSYGAYRLDAARGFAALSGRELDVIAAAVHYGGAGLTGRGSLLLQQHTRTTGYATVTTPPNSIPYLENLIPGMGLHGIAAVGGTDARLALNGYVAGAHGSDRLDAPFAIAADGNGSVGPVVLQRSDGATLYARAAIDRSANQTVALADVHGLSLLPAPAAALPGLALPALPPGLDAKLDADLTGIAIGSSLASASGSLHAFGSWGDVHADAAGAPSGFAARGRLTSSFERLAPLIGNSGLRGGVDVPFALSYSGGSTIVQIADARFPNAAFRGIPLQGASATVRLAPPAVDVYAAQLRIAGHNVTATGRYGNGGHVQVTAGDLDLDPLRAAGVPVSGGSASLIADLGGSLQRPTATVLAALGGARYANADLGGELGVAYDGAALHIDAATVSYGGAYANATGTVGGLTPGHIAPRYDVRAQVRDADIATLARTVKNPLRYPEGTLDADVHVGGAGNAPAFRGDVNIPEGSINGLDFNTVRVALRGDRNAVAADGGRVTVGTTTLDFGGRVSREQQSFTLHSSRIELTDFNDYFDEAEVLAGSGTAALSFAATPRAVNATADIGLRDTRYRRYDLGSVDARVVTRATAIGVAAEVNGINGRVNVGGNIIVPATDPLRDIVRRSDLDLQAQIAGINLGNVLPAAGANLPVLGIVDGAASVRGHYPALAVAAQAAVVHGVAGRVPIDRFTFALTAAAGRGRLTEATLAVPGLTASASGTFGVRPTDAFDLQARASSPDIDDLLTVATGKSNGVKGALNTSADLTGTIAQPRVRATVDLTNVTYSGVTVPTAHAEFDATRQAVDVRNGRVALLREGTIDFDGHAPLGSGAATPIALDFAPHHVDVNPYSSLRPDGSVVNGIFDGKVSVRGTLSAPLLGGNLAFRDGSYRSNTVKSTLTAIALNLDFAGTAVRVAKLHVHAAPGNIDGSGRLALRDLRDPIRGLTANLGVQIANAYVSAPKYYSGYVDGTIAARKAVAAPLAVSGNLAFSRGRIPYTALLPGGGSTKGPAPALPNVAFDLGVNAGRDVRVQSGPVDIGATGMARLGGTLAAPTLKGEFTATDGTVSLYRTFNVQNGSAVTFNPSDGIIPGVDATAVTNVPDPPTDVLLHVTGLATHLHLAFSSEPPYSQEQILGLLVNAQALGAVSGVAQTGGSTANSPSIVGIGEGLVNTQLTQKFLQPFTSALGGAIGLSDLNVNYNTEGSVSASARRRIGKNVSFVYGQQFGGATPRTSLGINVGTTVSGAQLTFYQAVGSNEAFGGQALTPFINSGFLSTAPPNYTLQSIVPPTGSGFVFSYQRHFW